MNDMRTLPTESVNSPDIGLNWTAGHSSSENVPPQPSDQVQVRISEDFVWPTRRYSGLHSRYRAVALQILYECDTTDHILGQIFHARLQSLLENGVRITPAGRDYIGALVFGVMETRTELDRCLGEVAHHFQVDALVAIDRNILRLALFEYISGSFESPVKVIVAEAIALADAYGSEQSPAFVHGVLGAAIKKMETRRTGA